MFFIKKFFQSKADAVEAAPEDPELTRANAILQREIVSQTDLIKAICDLKDVGTAEASMAAVIMLGSDRYSDPDSPIFDHVIVHEHLIPALKEMEMGAWALSAFAAEQARVYDHVGGDELGIKTDEEEVIEAIIGLGGDGARTALCSNIKSYYPDEADAALQTVEAEIAATLDKHGFG